MNANGRADSLDMRLLSELKRESEESCRFGQNAGILRFAQNDDCLG